MKKIVFLFLLFSNFLFSQERPNPWKYYTDYTGKYQDNLNIEGMLSEIYTKDSLVIAVTIVPDFNNYGTIEEYALNLGNQWRLYTYQKHNAVMLMICPSKRKSTIQVSESLTGMFPDGKCGEILRKGTPYFKSGKIQNGVEEIIKSFHKTYLERKSEGNTPIDVKPSPNDSSAGMFFFFVLVGIIGFILFVLITSFFRDRKNKNSKPPVETVTYTNYNVPSKPITKPSISQSSPKEVPKKETPKKESPVVSSEEDSYTPVIPYSSTNETSRDETTYSSSKDDSFNSSPDFSSGSDTSFSGGGATDSW